MAGRPLTISTPTCYPILFLVRVEIPGRGNRTTEGEMSPFDVGVTYAYVRDVETPPLRAAVNLARAVHGLTNDPM